MMAWFPCAWCDWAGDTTFHHPYEHDNETILFVCPQCGEENWDDIDPDGDN